MTEIPKLTTALDWEQILQDWDSEYGLKDGVVKYVARRIKSPLDEPVSCPHCYHTFIIGRPTK